jgi:Bifunctional DNA primase/polymerase, N-terminal
VGTPIPKSRDRRRLRTDLGTPRTRCRWAGGRRGGPPPRATRHPDRSNSFRSKKIDVRSARGYVAAPFSERPDGRRYEWLKRPGAVAVATAPDWFLKMLVARPQNQPPSRESLSDKGHRSLRDWISKLSGSVQRIVLGQDPRYVKPNRSEFDLQVITAFICIGTPIEILEQIFQVYPIGEKYREPDNGSRYLEKTIEYAFRFIRLAVVKYADLREYDNGGKRVHLALTVEGENGLVRTGITVPTTGASSGIKERWQHLFGACKVRVPGTTREEFELGVRSLRDKRMRILFSVSRENPVAGFFAV